MGLTLLDLEKVSPAAQRGRWESVGSPLLPWLLLLREGHGDGDHGLQRSPNRKRRGKERRKTAKTNPKFITTETTSKLPMLSLFLHEHQFLSKLFFSLKTLKLEENRPLYTYFHIHFLISSDIHQQKFCRYPRTSLNKMKNCQIQYPLRDTATVTWH